MNTNANQPLLPWQKSRLMMLAKEAYAVSLGRFAIEDGVTFDAWRAVEQGRPCGMASLGLREATQAQYRLIRGRWHVILGNAEAAFADFMAGGEENEARRQTMWHFAASVSTLAETWKKQRNLTDADASKQAWAYALHIASDKARGRPLSDMTPIELRNMTYTIRNRDSAHRGVGSNANRNKKQRSTRRAPALQAGLQPDRPPEIAHVPDLAARLNAPE